MENEMTGYILTLLENYAKTTKEIELLRYELQHCNIDFARGNDRDTGVVSPRE